jgi:adenylate kinase family enzyme
MRSIIIGNSGSGKSWLAAKLGDAKGCPVVHLDDIFWEPGGFDQKRLPEVVTRMIEESKSREKWIAEGVFGELAERFVDRAQCLIWLDIDWPTCRDRLVKRGSESKKHMGREESEQGLRNLVEWASQYYKRTNARSYEGHRKLMMSFQGQRVHLKSVADVTKLLEEDQPTSAGDVANRAALEK